MGETRFMDEDTNMDHAIDDMDKSNNMDDIRFMSLEY
jgi:hypothetical protein